MSRNSNLGFHNITDVPDAPEAPLVRDVTATSCLLSWQPPVNDGGSPVLGYYVERSSGFSPRWIRINKDLIPDLDLPVDDLIEGNSYEFRVLAANKAGISKPSESSRTIKAVNPWSKLKFHFMPLA